MTSKRYLAVLVAAVLGVVVPVIVINLLYDDFGLFWSKSEKRIWTREKTSKYLLSFRYIPQNFDGLLIGPSFSDGYMDTRTLGRYRVYNASMDAANATELRAVAVNALERGHMKILIICLSPYITQDAGMKSADINSKEYWGSLFSTLPLEIWRAKLDAWLHPERDTLAGSEWGMALPVARKLQPLDAFIRQETNLGPHHISVNSSALVDLRSIIEAAHRRGVKIYAYYYPYDIWRMAPLHSSTTWHDYQAQMRALFDPNVDVVWDMNDPPYRALQSDPACYTDAHLSAAGAAVVLADIRLKLESSQPGMPGREPNLAPGEPPCAGHLGAGSGYDRRDFTPLPVPAQP